METTTHADYSNIIGVFKEREQAEQALEALKQAGFREEQLTVFQPQDEEPAQAAELAPATRFLIHVRAEGREQEAVAILTQHGSNNADLPTGTVLTHGALIHSGDAANYQTHPQGVPEGASEAQVDIKNDPKLQHGL